jgi:hypothetical protein
MLTYEALSKMVGSETQIKAASFQKGHFVRKIGLQFRVQIV